MLGSHLGAGNDCCSCGWPFQSTIKINIYTHHNMNLSFLFRWENRRESNNTNNQQQQKNRNETTDNCHSHSAHTTNATAGRWLSADRAVLASEMREARSGARTHHRRLVAAKKTFRKCYTETLKTLQIHYGLCFRCFSEILRIPDLGCDDANRKKRRNIGRRMNGNKRHRKCVQLEIISDRFCPCAAFKCAVMWK